jgi:D-3-phosphoglycerate dehydrogenase
MAQATETAAARGAERVNVVRIGQPLPEERWGRMVAEAGGALTMTPVRGEAEVVAATREAEIIINAGGAFPAGVIAQLERCRLIVQASVGYDRIDVPAATARGIMIANLPDYCIEEVAEHALTLTLASARRLPAMERTVRDGAWNNRGYQSIFEMIGPVRRLRHTTLGIVGFGKIGKLVARKASGVGWRIVAADPFVTAEDAAALGVELLPLEELLRGADFVTLHVLLSPETRGLINAERLALMKPSAYLVNTCRGPIVDEAALIAALREGRLAGAGLDVFEHEPLALDSPLRDLPNVILTPHFAVYSAEAIEANIREPFEEVVRVLGGRWPRGLVNRELKERLSGYRD